MTEPNVTVELLTFGPETNRQKPAVGAATPTHTWVLHGNTTEVTNTHTQLRYGPCMSVFAIYLSTQFIKMSRVHFVRDGFKYKDVVGNKCVCRSALFLKK